MDSQSILGRALLANASRSTALPGQSTRKKSEQGQATILVGVMLLTFFFFFCFVVNVGVLVNAKINLQNAADLAAYAGAATQARQLNRISFLNYEMRRQYKKFLFRYYVVGNMAQKSFPTSSPGNGTTAMKWSPDNAFDYQVPTVCLVFDEKDNFCQIKSLPHIDIPPPSNFDLINNALNQQLTQLEQIRENNCEKIGLTNMTVLALWLWSTSLNFTPDVGLPQDIATIQPVINGLVQGLGLVPRELLLRQRITTLTQYLNQAHQHGVTLQGLSAMSQSSDPTAFERTIQAFYSAYYTLGENTFSSGSLAMDELQSDTQINLNDIKTNFDTYAIYHMQVGDPNSPSNAKNCESAVVSETLLNEFPIAVSKDPNVMTYYAVRLTAQPKLLFNPWQGMTMTAYAAAQPFGSRIGPPANGPTPLTWTRDGKPSISINTAQQGALSSQLGKIPNLPVRTGEGNAAGTGWDTQEVMGSLITTGLSNLTTANPNGGGFEITSDNLQAAYHVAMAPNPWEVAYYNIPSDLDQGYARQFGTAGGRPYPTFYPSIFDSNRRLMFWAPLTSPGVGNGDVTTAVQTMISDLFNGVGSTAALQSTLKTQIAKYINDLQSGTPGEDGETFNLASITHPFYPLPGNNVGAASFIQLPQWMMPTDPKVVQTSWNAPNDPMPGGAPGRVGYSVRFVSFDSLSHSKIKTNGQQSFSNNLISDETLNLDLNFIQH